MEKEHPEKLTDEQSEASRFPSLPNFPELPSFSPPPSFPSLSSLPTFSQPPSFSSLPTNPPNKEYSTEVVDNEASTLSLPKLYPPLQTQGDEFVVEQAETISRVEQEPPIPPPLSPLPKSTRARIQKLSPPHQTPRSEFAVNPAIPKPRVGQGLFIPPSLPPLPNPTKARGDIRITEWQVMSEKPAPATAPNVPLIVVGVIVFIVVVALVPGLFCPLVVVGIIVLSAINASKKHKAAFQANAAAMRHKRKF